jgi:cytochrome c5
VKIPILLVSTFLTIVATATSVLGEKPDPFDRLRSGKENLDSACSTCHLLKLPLSEVLDRQEWEALVDEMVEEGANLSSEEKATVVDYLTVKSSFETKCTVCHGSTHALTKKKVREAWFNTVSQMAEKKPDLFSQRELAEISWYLYFVLGAE